MKGVRKKSDIVNHCHNDICLQSSLSNNAFCCRCTLNPVHHQLSHLSSFPPPPPPPPPFRIAAVPMEPPAFFSAAAASRASPNESQKSFRSGATSPPDLAVEGPPAPVSSTKLLNLSAATLVPDCMPLAATAAVSRACFARSASAIWKYHQQQIPRRYSVKQEHNASHVP